MVGMIGMEEVMSSDIAKFRMVKVEDLKFEDMVDLYEDTIADPDSDEVSFEFEMQVVDEVSLTGWGILVQFNEAAVDFPHGYEVKVSNDSYKPELIT